MGGKFTTDDKHIEEEKEERHLENRKMHKKKFRVEQSIQN
jgi:hypothetical protein